MHATQYRNPPNMLRQGQHKQRFGSPEPMAKASVLRTVNFKRLAVAAGGPDELGSILEITVGRLKALEEGHDFSDETAFHFETELGLPSGWFDQKDPELPASIRRQEESEGNLPEKVVEVSRKVDENKGMARLQRPKQADTARDSKAAKELSVSPAPTSGPSSVERPVSLEVPSMSTASNVNDAVLAARLMRRENLTALTSWPKSKSGLARLLQKTPANVSHLIHGEKNFDREAALEIERVTGLPENWFEVPRAAQDVPTAVVTRMTGNTAPGMPPAPQKPAAVSTHTRKRGRPRQAPVAQAAPVVQAALSPLPAADDAVARRRGRPRRNAEEAGAGAPVASPVSRFTPPDDASVAVPRGPVMRQETSRMLRESEGQMGAIAEALVRTIAEKSRTGQFSEKAAYKMLSEVMDN